MACYLLAAILSANKSKAFQSKRMEFLPFFCKASCHSNHCNKTFIAAIKQTSSKKVPKHFPHHKVHYIHPPHLFLKHFVISVFFLVKFGSWLQRSFPFHAFRWNPVFPQLQGKLLVQKGAPKKDCRSTTKIHREMLSWVEGGWAPGNSIFWWKI